MDEQIKRWYIGAPTDQEVLDGSYFAWKKKHQAELDSLRKAGVEKILNRPEERARDSLGILGRQDAYEKIHGGLLELDK